MPVHRVYVDPGKPVLSFDSVPQKRKQWWKRFSILFYVFVAVVFIGVIIEKSEEVECKNDSHGNCTGENTQNRLAGLCMLGFSISSAIVTIFVKRTILFLEEIITGQQTTRYDGNFRKLFKACFGKLHCLGLIIVVLLAIVFISVPLTKEKCISQWKSILIAIGIAPMFVRLLLLDTFCDVEISTIIEENRKGVGYTLALDYHLRHLHGISTDQNAPRRHYILVPSDCDTTKALNALDERITTNEIGLYSFVEGQNSFNDVSIEYAAPLKTLLQLEKYDTSFGFPNEKEIIYETKMFYGTLKKKLSNCEECREGKIVLVPYDKCQLAEDGEKLGDLLFRIVPQENRAIESPIPHESPWQYLYHRVLNLFNS